MHNYRKYQINSLPLYVRHSSRLRGKRIGVLPHLYRGAKLRHHDNHVFEADHVDSHLQGRFRWFLSTCLAAAVGSVAIVVIIYGSSDTIESSQILMPALEKIHKNKSFAAIPEPHKTEDGLKWAIAKTDRLQETIGTTSTRFIIHETLKQRRKGRDYIYAKPYVRIISKLASVPDNLQENIPPFNPLKLYVESKPVTSNLDDKQETLRTDISIRILELLGALLPIDDEQELNSQEINDIVQRTKRDNFNNTNFVDVASSSMLQNNNKADIAPDTNVDLLYGSAPNQSILVKTSEDSLNLPDDFENQQVRVIKVSANDTLSKILSSTGADAWLIKDMLEPAKTVFPEAALAPGQEVHITLVPSLDDNNKMEPVSFSIFGDGHEHLITVSRSAGGEFTASGKIPQTGETVHLNVNGSASSSSNLYSSLFYSALNQNISGETIQQILKIHASETDFRRRLSVDDTAEYFFDLKQENGTEGPPGDLIYTSLRSGGETSTYYRFRSSDGIIDFYDKDGNNSRKFLLRKPVRGEDSRLTSGFGIRLHPLLGVRKMHTGVDWSAPPGTPILAAGSGTIEEAGRKGYNGNYVRIRHANGYQTAYSHMSEFAPGVRTGIKVKQGQIIGYVGTTGLSSGPHLHYEVLINTRFVDPLSIQVPRERRLVGKDLEEFQKERRHIEDIMRLTPVMTASR
ncbi:MAG: M23 family metallopeptidase [Hyphomicrobium sp.]